MILRRPNQAPRLYPVSPLSPAFRGLIALWLVGWAALAIPGAALAQDKAPPAGQQEEPPPAMGDAKPESPERVDVRPLARDEEISERLTEILESTQWFQNPRARVENGVVFLTGVAKKSDYLEWASGLASKTQDVAAVVNQMTLPEQSIWDFRGAFNELRKFQTGLVQAVPFILFGILVLFLTWLVAWGATWGADRLLSRRMPNQLLRWVASRAIMIPILIFGIYLVLRISGLTQLALTVLGGTGLFGLIIGIAFRDIVENFLASILISTRKPFRVGDLIRVVDNEGIVDRVTTRGTTILTQDGNHVQIPNALIYKNTIVNYTANPIRRLSFNVGIGYDDSISEAQNLIMDCLRKHAATLDDPAPRVIVEQLGPAAVSLSVLFWVNATVHDFLSVRSSVMRITKQTLLESGVSLPDEAREVIFPAGVPVRFEGDRSAMAPTPGETAPTQPPAERIEEEPLPVSQPTERAFSSAEGNMTSETDELKRQADASWNPDQGHEILVDDEDEPKS